MSMIIKTMGTEGRGSAVRIEEKKKENAKESIRLAHEAIKLDLGDSYSWCKSFDLINQMYWGMPILPISSPIMSGLMS